MPDTLIAQPPTDDTLADAVRRAADALARRQHPDGHWLFELEADATIPAEYVLLEHFLDRIDAPLEAKIGVYLRAIQGAHGGWPLFHDGAFNMSASVKAYFALKAIGDDPDAPHMARARAAILAAGGAERTNVFTRAQLALFGQVPWRAVPVMPLEIMHLPLWFPFHLSKVSYWSRTVIVPLLVLMALRPRRPQSARRAGAGVVPHAARAGARLDPRAVPVRLGPLLQGRRYRPAASPSRCFLAAGREARSARPWPLSPSD